MFDQFDKYTRKLVSDRSAAPDEIAFAAKDDRMVSCGNDSLSLLAEDVLSRLNALGLCVARPSLPFADFLIRRTPRDAGSFVPTDTETRTFLHDIPFLRREDLAVQSAERLAALLGQRKGVLAEGIGILAVGALTVEQAYINYSSVFHAVFVKYLRDLVVEGFLLQGEREAFVDFRAEWGGAVSADGLLFADVAGSREEILEEIDRVGRYTVERGLVDSFFGNISCREGNIVYISQTAASLDELHGCIDPVPFDNSSTAGITASSELLAHRKIYETTGARTILHGHPKFSVVMSMLCGEAGCGIEDCWKDCPRVRYVAGTPVVAGEIGAGGIAKRVPPVIGETGAAIVFGHGVFCTGRSGFREAFLEMVKVENSCRAEYFRRVDALAAVSSSGMILSQV